MKSIDELGVSPWPWKTATNDCGEKIGIVNGRGFYVARFATDVNPRDARLIAAAPEMYERLYTIVHHVVCSCPRKDCETCNANTCWVKKAKAVLAKAAGEKEGGAK